MWFNFQMFYVMYGKLVVEIHRSKSPVESGDTFVVPPGELFEWSLSVRGNVL